MTRIDCSNDRAFIHLRKGNRDIDTGEVLIAAKSSRKALPRRSLLYVLQKPPVYDIVIAT
jgi:hypothetical protein